MSITDLVKGMKGARLSRAPAILVAIAALGALTFFYLGHEVGEDEFRQFDSAILLWLRNPADLSQPIGPPWLAESVLEITALGGYTLIILLVAAVIGFLLVAGLRGPALFVFLSVLTGWLASQVLKSFYSRPRPDLVPQLDVVHTASFPSGHATMTALVYLTLAAVIARLTDRTSLRIYVFAAAALISIIVGLSRVYLGVHWPSDVIAGWVLGAAWAALSWLVVSALRYRRERETQRTASR
jgi:undecaprenyl-diphosphatase